MKCEHCSGTMMLSRGNVGEPDVQKCMSCGRTNAPTAAAEVSTSGRMSLSNEEKIMRCIETYGMATRRMLNQRGLTAEEINYIPRTLVSHGKLQAWPTAKDGNFIYTLPGAADPRFSDPAKQVNPGTWKRGPKKAKAAEKETPPPQPAEGTGAPAEDPRLYPNNFPQMRCHIPTIPAVDEQAAGNELPPDGGGCSEIPEPEWKPGFGPSPLPLRPRVAGLRPEIFTPVLEELRMQRELINEAIESLERLVS